MVVKNWGLHILTEPNRQPQKFASPTDEIQSPCSQKLSNHKAKLFEKYVFSVFCG